MRMHVCFAVYTQMHTVFINTFLLKATGDTEQVMLFNIMLSIVQPLAMVCAVFLIRRKSPILSQRVGIGLYIFVYILLAVCGEQASGWSLLIAALLSAAAGFYYATYALQLLSYSDDRSRDLAMGVIGVLNGVAALFTPMLSGLLISAFPGFTGYRILFAGAFLTAAASAWFSSRLSNLKEFDRQRRTYFKPVLRALAFGKIERGVMLTTVIRGFRDGTIVFFLNMLLYQFINSEALVGLNAFLGGLAAILSAWLYGRLARPGNRNFWNFAAITAATSAALLLFWNLDPLLLIAFNVVNGLLGAFIQNPSEAVYLGSVQNLSALRGRGAEVHTVREFYLSAGRIAGIVVTMLLPQNPVGWVAAIVCLNLSQYLAAFLVRRTQRQLEALVPEPALQGWESIKRT